MLGRIDHVDARSEDGQRRALRGHRASMRGRIDAARKDIELSGRRRGRRRTVRLRHRRSKVLAPDRLPTSIIAARIRQPWTAPTTFRKSLSSHLTEIRLISPEYSWHTACSVRYSGD